MKCMKRMRKTFFLNSSISLIACKIHKYKMFCRIENKEEKPQEICYHVDYILIYSLSFTNHCHKGVLPTL